MRQLLQGLSRERRAALGTVTATLPPRAALLERQGSGGSVER
jgi:hypothetical protein